MNRCDKQRVTLFKTPYIGTMRSTNLDCAIAARCGVAISAEGKRRSVSVHVGSEGSTAD